jgi:hypothetical protein
MLELVRAINQTNSRTAFGDKRTVSDAIINRDVVGMRTMRRKRINALD